jgi:catechol 2,3-dioxygenase-like lactoylglutathione lyase family enzyme
VFRTTDLARVIVATADVEAAVATFRKNFGFDARPEAGGTLPDARSASLGIAAAEIEFAAPSESGSPLDAFLAERGPGLFEIVLEVDDLEAAAIELAERGLDVARGSTADGRPKLLLSPAQTNGARIALVPAA